MLWRLSLFLGFVFCLLPAAVTAAAAERPVVVELFTSEGCSSCPPADNYLTELSQGRPDVLPLAFHITYWDSLGWKDPFSLAAATDRQVRYAARLGGRPYTPEAVIDGAIGVVGSDHSEVGAAIRKSKSEGRTAASISARRQGGQLSIEVGPGNGSGRVLLIGFDHEHRTAVARGENSGRTLIESNVVRSIRPVGEWSGAPLQISEPFPAAQDVAILLEAPDGRIIGASRLAAITSKP
jgi:hypothetical protein